MNVLSRNWRRLSGAWRAGHRAARWAVLRAACAPIGRALDALVSAVSGRDTLPPPSPRWVLLCSPPRSGSTVTYQVLSRVLVCRYVTNLHQVAPRCARLLLSNFGTSLAMPSGFDNYYGHTADWRDVSEGNELIDYWFRSDDLPAIRSRFIESMAWLTGGENLPVVVKNVKVYERLSELHAAIPELVFVRIQRDPEQVVQSELRGFRELGTFNPIPAELENAPWDDPLDCAVRQILAIERTIDRELAKVADAHLVRWSYEDFCADPRSHLESLAALMDIDADWSRLPTTLEASRTPKVPIEEVQRIRQRLASLSPAPRERRA